MSWFLEKVMTDAWIRLFMQLSFHKEKPWWKSIQKKYGALHDEWTHIDLSPSILKPWIRQPAWLSPHPLNIYVGEMIANISFWSHIHPLSLLTLHSKLFFYKVRMSFQYAFKFLVTGYYRPTPFLGSMHIQYYTGLCIDSSHAWK